MSRLVEREEGFRGRGRGAGVPGLAWEVGSQGSQTFTIIGTHRKEGRVGDGGCRSSR